MRTKEAVAQRILELCRERNIAVNALANISGVSLQITLTQHHLHGVLAPP